MKLCVIGKSKLLSIKDIVVLTELKTALMSYRNTDWTFIMIGNVDNDTIEDGIKDTKLVAEFLGISDFMLCNSINGLMGVSCGLYDGVWRCMTVTVEYVESQNLGDDVIIESFSLPSPGMLNYFENLQVCKFEDCLMIGTDTQENGIDNHMVAAVTAGFRFMDLVDVLSGISIDCPT